MLTSKLLLNVCKKQISRKIAIVCTFCGLLIICSGLSKSFATISSEDKQTSNLIQDPTKPPQNLIATEFGQTIEVPEYILTAIFSRASQIYAVINGNVLKVGDTLANILVVDIKETSVVIREKDSFKKDVVLELNSSVSIKKQVSQ